MARLPKCTIGVHVFCRYARRCISNFDHIMYAAFLKRGIDLVLATIFMVGALPFMMLISTAIVLESGRPVFFRQVRTGRGGVPFTLWKFRTLQAAPGEPTRPLDRVTRVGRVLRRFGLDELPQLWNVIRGDMSLVGPRPTLPEQAARYGAYERQRLAVRPGLTGWAQIHGRNAIDWQRRIELDVEYVRRIRPGLDLLILVRTPFVLASGAGVYGPDGVNPDYLPAADR